MAESLQIVASLFTIWAQSSILSENKEYDRFKEDDKVIEHQIEMQQRRIEILEASMQRRDEILLSHSRVLSQTQLK